MNYISKKGIIYVLAVMVLVGTPMAAAKWVPWKKPRQTDFYRVTIQNLTAGQALTPPVVATHYHKNLVYQVGEPASEGVQAIAENGNNAPLLEQLEETLSVFDTAVGDSGPLVPAGDPYGTGFGSSANVLVAANHYSRYVSTISMLICTNDGFSGLNSLELPDEGSTVALTPGFDAGTEINTEDYADLVPPCQGLFNVVSGDPGTGTSNPALAEDGVIAYHEGIQGGVDLPAAIHDWNDPVVKTTITCIDEHAVRFETPLSGAAEVPPVSTYADGKAHFFLAERFGKLYFVVHVNQIFGVTQAHIHYGLPDENGPVVAFLYGPSDASGLLNGQLSSGVIGEDDLLAVFDGDFEGFVEALRNGELYVNVHTVDNPPGEIRGQIGAVPNIRHLRADRAARIQLRIGEPENHVE